jgi:hypothetical protein
MLTEKEKLEFSAVRYALTQGHTDDYIADLKRYWELVNKKENVDKY